MKLKVSLFCLLLFLSAAFYNVLLVSSTALFLNQIGARNIPKVYIIIAVLIPAVTFALQTFLQFIHRYKYVFILYLSIMAAILFSIWRVHAVSESKYYLWIYFALGLANFKLIRMVSWNFLGRYFNVFDSRTYFPLFSAVEETGVIVSGLLISFVFLNLGLAAFLGIEYISLIGIGLMVLLIATQKEIHFKTHGFASQPQEEKIQDFVKTKMFLSLAIIFIAYEAMKYGLGYEFNTVLKHQFDSIDGISRAMSLYMIATSCLVIIFNLFISRYIFKYFMLPNIQIVYAGVVFLALAVLNIIPFWFVFILAEFFRKTFDHILFNPSYQQISNTFTPKIRLGLKSLMEGFITPTSGLLVSFCLFFFTSIHSFWMLNILLLVLSVVWIAAAFKFKAHYLAFHINNLLSGAKELTIRSVQALGERKNFMAMDPLLGLLKRNPKKLVRKNVILSLGRIQIEDLIKTIFKEMEQPYEELQIATIRSLSEFDSFLVQRFLIDLIQGNKCKSLQVRFHTLSVLHNLMGDTIIPILLPYLESNDDRIVANTVEAMAVSKNKKTMSILEPFLNHGNNRVRANAVMALYQFKKMRPKCVSVLEEMFKSKNELNRLSFIYAVGKLRLSRFKDKLKEMSSIQNNTYKHNVAFALSNMEDLKGYDLFSDLFLSNDANLVHACLHHFLQLKMGIRFRILENYDDRKGDVDSLIIMLKSSKFDFHEEIDFLRSLER